MATAVKVGGSLLTRPSTLRSLMALLSEADVNHELVVIPGGGPFADTVRHVDREAGLPSTAAHRMAILAMDQYGLLLEGLAGGGCRAVYTFSEVKESLSAGRMPILLPSRILFHEEPFKPSWEVTSDSISAWMAGRMGASKLLLLKDVDGIFDSDPKGDPGARLLRRVSVKRLLRGDLACVDPYLPRVLSTAAFRCFVVNGFHPERVVALIEGREEGVWTEITVEGL